jgi:hypothetical protein
LATNKFKVQVKKALLLFIVAGPFYLFFLPADYFDSGDTLCIYKNLFDFDCPGCGLTRGIMHLMHLDFKTAWRFSPLSFLVAPLLAMLWLHLLAKLVNRKVFGFFEKLY